MKLKEKYKAVSLRQKGTSITTIAEDLNVSKGSVSRWVKDVQLSAATLSKIRARSHSAAAVEARRISRLKKEDARRAVVIERAKNSISRVTQEQLFLVGIALYWGEGSKKKRGVAEFTNSDPRMIKIMKKFFKSVCKVPESKFRGHVYLHEHMDKKNAEQYWSKVANIPLQQFHKTSIQKNKNRVQKDTLPYGTFAIVICDTSLKLSLDGWTEGLCANV